MPPRDPSNRFTSTSESLGLPPGYSARYAPSISESEAIQPQGGQAGVGAGTNAYQPDTPSMYTDPFEYATAVNEPQGQRRPNVVSTRPLDDNYLDRDPYARDDAANRAGNARLKRADTINTLGPNDSVSVVGQPYASTSAAAARDASGYGHAAYESAGSRAPLRQAGAPQGMGGAAFAYAEDEEDERRQREAEYSNGAYEHTHGYSENHGYSDPNQTYGHAYTTSDGYDTRPLGGPGAASASGHGHGHNYPSTAYDDDAWDPKYRMSYDDGHRGADGGAPVLFSNNMAGAPGVAKEGFEGEGGDDADRRGLLGFGAAKNSSAKGRRAGWGGSLEEQIDRRRFGLGRQRLPILSWILAAALVVVFIVELVKSAQVTGQAVQTRPTWNPMLGPPFEFLISFGARFSPCMRSTTSIPATQQLPCLNQTTTSSNTYTADQLCPIWEICGLPGPNVTGQGWRFITPIFVHAGFIHIIFNLLVQLTLCCQIERLLSTPFYALVWLAGGIGGNLLGGNFGLEGQPAVGASGAIYTCISLELVDLCYNWKYEQRAKTRLTVSLVFAIIGLAIGLLPGMDNWSHLGGFAVGLLGGLLFCPSIHPSKTHRVSIWVLRLVALGLLIGFFVGLATNFYNTSDPSAACPWCRYLSCLPVFSQCKGNGLTSSTSTTTSTSN